MNIGDLDNLKTEHQHQVKLIQLCIEYQKIHPCLALIYAIPNAGKRSKKQGRWMVSEGLRSGVPDLCLPVPMGKYGALYIELKRNEKQKKTELQTAWIETLRELGNRAEFAYGWKHAMTIILDYLENNGGKA